MDVKFHRHHFIPSSSSKPIAARHDYLLSQKRLIKFALYRNFNRGSNYRFPGRKRPNFQLASSPDDGVTVNGSPSASNVSSDDVEEMRAKLALSLQGGEGDGGYGERLVQALHDAARVFELAIKERVLLSKLPWFSTAWLGIDRNGWAKTLAYQASVYTLLQAACEISSRGDGRDRDVNIFVQRSLLRQSASLESLIREKLSAKKSEAYEWFWSEQVPAAIVSFIDYFERDPRFTAATAVLGIGLSAGSGSGSDISLLLLALTCIAAITNLGTTKVSCPQFFSVTSDIIGKLMDMLVDFIPIRQAYHSIKEIGLGKEFLVHFGPRAAACRVRNDRDSEEVVFWVNLVQKHLQQAIDRERIWSRLTTSESIEVLEKDLAIFGFFIALGRSTQSFLCANGFDVIDDPIESFVRYLIGGSVLYYPQLSSISSYQLYVEVVCEELDWLPFYPGNNSNPKQFRSHKGKQEGSFNTEAIPKALDVCSHWMQSFIKYSKWLENPSNIKAAQFLSRGHNKLTECMEELENRKMSESQSSDAVEGAGSRVCLPTDKESDSFDKALESVEEALIRLENLLQELHLSNSDSGKEQLKAACSDLEKIRKLKKEAEFLEASFRAKAASLQQGDDESNSQSNEQQEYLKWKKRKNASARLKTSNSKFRGLRNFMRSPTKTTDLDVSVSDDSGDEHVGQTSSIMGAAESESNEIRRFELLRNELMELEKRVQRSTNQSENEEDSKVIDDSDTHNDESGSAQSVRAQKKENIIGKFGKSFVKLREASAGIKVIDNSGTYSDDAGNAKVVKVQKKENAIEKSIDKLKETGTDVLQGTQLLAIDVVAAMGLLKRILIGDELAEKEKKALRRTLTDLASVVPIGVLMLLPVTAVGHAAMLAAIQRYVPSLIPSTYAPERLDLLRQLEKVKEMEDSEADAEENGEE